MSYLATSFDDTKTREEDDTGRNALHRLANCILKIESDDLVPARDIKFPVSSSKEYNRITHSSNEDFLLIINTIQLRASLIRVFLSQGIDINAYDSFGNTVLMEFVRQFRYENEVEQPASIVEILLQNGAMVNSRNSDGETALHLAARHARLPIIQALIQHGANVHARNRKGQSVIQLLEEEISESRDFSRRYIELGACSKWLSDNSVGSLPSPMNEWCLGNSILEPVQPAPAEAVGKIEDFISHYEKKGSTRSPQDESATMKEVNEETPGRKDAQSKKSPWLVEPSLGRYYRSLIQVPVISIYETQSLTTCQALGN